MSRLYLLAFPAFFATLLHGALINVGFNEVLAFLVAFVLFIETAIIILHNYRGKRRANENWESNEDLYDRYVELQDKDLQKRLFGYDKNELSKSEAEKLK